jgi:hypothetical protein
MNKFYMDDVQWKLPQLFYFRQWRLRLLQHNELAIMWTESTNDSSMAKMKQ